MELLQDTHFDEKSSLVSSEPPTSTNAYRSWKSTSSRRRGTSRANNKRNSTALNLCIKTLVGVSIIFILFLYFSSTPPPPALGPTPSRKHPPSSDNNNNNNGGSGNKQTFSLAHVYSQAFPDVGHQDTKNIRPGTSKTADPKDMEALKMMRAEAKSRGYAYPFIVKKSNKAQPEDDMHEIKSGKMDISFDIRGRQSNGRYIDDDVEEDIVENHSYHRQGSPEASSSMLLSGEKMVSPSQVRGTARLLHKLRGEYLTSSSGKKQSYWYKHDGDDADKTTPRNQFADKNDGATLAADDTARPSQPSQDDDPSSTPLPPSGQVPWDYFVDDGLLIPNVKDRRTVINLARMAADAYRKDVDDQWEPLGKAWDTRHSFGWREDGLRGHVFVSKDNQTIVLSLKGTSGALFLGGDAETSTKDKFNDNRLFSCCCARVDFSWSTVCDCYMGGSKCNATCLETNVNDDPDIYFHAAAEIYMDVARAYPNSNIVLTGHSLGGSVASLIGLTFGVPVVAFEAPGEALAAKRLHLPVPRSEKLMAQIPTWHFGHTADPIYMGVCTGPSSLCYYGGYALESKCHLGNQCVFDTVRLLDWRLDVRHHRIIDVIYLVLEPWGLNNKEEKWPVGIPESEECEDCGLWKFVDDSSPQ